MERLRSREAGVRPVDRSLPEIYRLTSERAPSEALANQVVTDFAEGTRAGNERAALGIHALVARGEEGRAILRDMSGREPRTRLSAACDFVLGRNRSTERMIEAVLGNDTDLNAVVDTSQAEDIAAAYEEVLKRGLYTGPFEDFRAEVNRHLGETRPSQLTNTIERQLYTNCATVGMQEPTYVELLGPREILRLRSMREPAMLLLGSYGKYSAEEFERFAHKITAGARAVVIDSDAGATKIVHRNNPETLLAQADARTLPFAGSSLDVVCTNHLFHFLDKSPLNIFRVKKRIRQVLSEAFRVLRPGGSMLVVEQPYWSWQARDSQSVRNEIIQLAHEAGFRVANAAPDMVYLLVPDSCSARIDENGYAQYGDALISISTHGSACLRLEKPGADSQ